MDRLPAMDPACVVSGFGLPGWPGSIPERCGYTQREGGGQMKADLLATLEREVLAWPGVTKETHPGGAGQGGFWVPPFTLYRFGRREIGHVHDTGVADLTVGRQAHDALVAAGRAQS